MNDTSGPRGGAYLHQHQSVAAEVADRVRQETGRRIPHDLVFCSRSGPPQVPWLEPDVNDHLEAVAARGASAVVIVPIGFVSDHMEVIYDLDTEALATAEKLGLPAVRVPTPGLDPRFVAMVRDLVLERAAVERGESVARAAVGALPAAHDLCARPLLPEPPGAAAHRGRDTRDGRAGQAAAPSPWRSRPRRPPLIRTERAAGVAVADTKTSGHRRRHRVDRASEQLIRTGCCSRPGRTTASSARKAAPRWARAVCAGSSTPSTAP